MPNDTLPDWEQVLTAPFRPLLSSTQLIIGLAAVQIQLANPLPYDLEELNLVEYKNLDARWYDWQTVKAACADYATLIFDHIVGLAVCRRGLLFPYRTQILTDQHRFSGENHQNICVYPANLCPMILSPTSC